MDRGSVMVLRFAQVLWFCLDQSLAMALSEGQ
jgi:hypothetical protein